MRTQFQTISQTLRKQFNIRIYDEAKQIGVSSSTLSGYENCTKSIDLSILNTISKYFTYLGANKAQITELNETAQINNHRLRLFNQAIKDLKDDLPLYKIKYFSINSFLQQPTLGALSFNLTVLLDDQHRIITPSTPTYLINGHNFIIQNVFDASTHHYRFNKIFDHSNPNENEIRIADNLASVAYLYTKPIVKYEESLGFTIR